MNVKVEQAEARTSAAEASKYAGASLLALIGFLGFYWFSDWPAALRAALLLVAIIAAGAVFALSTRGQMVIEFLSESRFELRKVVWPSRQETMRATGVIFVVVLILSLLLALFDLIISSLVRWLLGG